MRFARFVLLAGSLVLLAGCNSKSSSSTEYSPVQPTNNPPTAGNSPVVTNAATNSIPSKLP